jgi:hypothetical protein
MRKETGNCDRLRCKQTLRVILISMTEGGSCISSKIEEVDALSSGRTHFVHMTQVGRSFIEM